MSAECYAFMDILAGERIGKEEQERLSSGQSGEKVVGGFGHHRADKTREGGDRRGGDTAEDDGA